MKSNPAWHRVTIEGVRPEVEGGRYPAKCIIGDEVIVEADIYTDGHDAISAVLRHRKEGEAKWRETPFQPLVNDRWRAAFHVTELGRYVYTIEAWVDRFATWSRDLAKKANAGQDTSVDLLVGADLVKKGAQRAKGKVRGVLQDHADRLASEKTPAEERLALALDPTLLALMARWPDRRRATPYSNELVLVADPKKAGFSAWYEMFPRSTAPHPGAHGTFKDCEARLPYIAEMGFDVLYLPPIHPIGRTLRKGRNNRTVCEPDDPGSPWAIGAREGGHKAVHPELGTLEDFERFVVKAKEHGIDVALDIAFQCSPDHPYVTEHPSWFRWRPDGKVQYAENPPKKYEDIYPFDFETEDWESLWEELESVFRFWIERGVFIFRVDNPHTKPFPFWEWTLGRLKKDHPELIFLSEAFTRPKVMYNLAKLGFTQSYTYFAWRNTQWELTDYFTELTQTDVADFFRPNLWPNTPDILTEFLQTGGRPAFIIRLVLAATLGSTYGIYGPAFELMESEPREPGSEEYLNSEKYEIRHWGIDRPDSLRELIGVVNRVRREHAALQQNRTLKFHFADNQQLLCYSKTERDGSDAILVVVNLDPYHTHSGWVHLDLDALGLNDNEVFQVHDVLGQGRYLWRGSRNYIELNPGVVPAHIFRLRRRVRTERDFDYYM